MKIDIASRQQSVEKIRMTMKNCPMASIIETILNKCIVPQLAEIEKLNDFMSNTDPIQISDYVKKEASMTLNSLIANFDKMSSETLLMIEQSFIPTNQLT